MRDAKFYSGRKISFLFIFIFLFNLSTVHLAHAQGVRGAVSRSPRKLNKETYLAHVKPILFGIFNNFYQLIGRFPDYPVYLIDLLQKVESLESDKKILRYNCPKIINKKCETTLNSIRAKLIHIEMLSLKIMRSEIKSSSLFLNHLSGHRLISTFQTSIDDIKGRLDNTSFFQVAEINFNRKTQRILKDLDELETYINLSILEFIPGNYKEDFKQFYFNFIHPLKLQFTRESAANFIGHNMNSFNFAINLFHQTLTKRKKTPKGMSTFLYLIHRRWNNLLRYYM